MSSPPPAALFAALDATWPAQRVIELPGWRVREGKGGGSRVSAATATLQSADLRAMEAAHSALGQVPLVMVRGGQEALDRRLEAAGYHIKDPVVVLSAPVEALIVDPPRVTAFHVNWPPLTIQSELWAEGGIGPERLAVMRRVDLPKTALFGRIDDRPAGTAFLAADGPIAMLHALEITPPQRRKGLARHMMHGAGIWAQARGAKWLSVLVTRENAPARALYASLGLEEVEEYHYRTR